MSRQNLTNIEPTVQNIPNTPAPPISGTGNADIQQELNQYRENGAY